RPWCARRDGIAHSVRQGGHRYRDCRAKASFDAPGDIPPCIRRWLVPVVKFFGQRCPNGGAGQDLGWGGGRRKKHFGHELPLFLALAVPLSCLAFLSSLALLGVMTLGGVIHLLGTVRPRRR